MKHFSFRANVWRYPSFAGWHFVTVDKKISEKIKELQQGKLRRGFGAVAVTATLGRTSWKTSVFPDKRAGAYIMALKASVRKKEGVLEKDKVSISIKI